MEVQLELVIRWPCAGGGGNWSQVGRGTAQGGVARLEGWVREPPNSSKPGQLCVQESQPGAVQGGQRRLPTLPEGTGDEEGRMPSS